MRKIYLASLATLALFATGCEGGTGTTAISSGNNGTATVRVANTTAGAPTIDVLANDSIIFDSVLAGVTTAPTTVPEGAVTFVVRTTGTTSTLTNTSASLVAGTDYTLVVEGIVPNMTARVVSDTTL